MDADEYPTSCWSRDDDIRFERAIATYAEDLPDRWDRIAADVVGKSLEEVKRHYEILAEDVKMIESGLLEMPCYNSYSPVSDEGSGKKGGKFGHSNGESNQETKGSKSDQERRKGIAWTEDEHRLFLLGLEKYGKGDWRSISRNYVVTRTPTQVASHAQKYFIRLNSMNKDRRRSSIHDITSVNGGEVAAPHQGPVTGQTNSGGSSSKSNKHPLGIGMYGAATPIGQPIRGPLVSAIGTPVNLAPPHLGYGVGTPVTGHVVPVNGGPVTYPMPHTPSSG